MIKLKQHPENVNFKRFYMKFGRNRRSTKCVSFLTNARCNLKAPHWTHISRRILVPGKFLYLKVGINQIAMVETSRQPDANILHVRHLLEIEHSRNSSFSDLISSKIILSLKMARVLIKRTKIKIAINISRIKAEFKNEFKTYKPQLLEEYRIGDNSLPNLLENSTVPCKVSLTKIQPDNPMLKLAIAEANKRQKQISRKINKRVKLHHFKFRCQEDVCTAYFASEELLNQHVQEEHAKPLKCIVAECGKSFMNPNLMEQHLTSNDKNIEHIKEHTGNFVFKIK